MRRDPKAEFLRSLPIFAGCSRSEIKAIAAITDEVLIDAGTPITVEGQRGLEFFVIVDGTAVVRKHDEVVATLGAGDFIGEIALVTGEPRTATVVAATPVNVLVIAWHSFATLVEKTPGLRVKVDSAVVERQAA